MCDDTLYSLAIDPCLLNLPGVTKLKYTLAKWVDVYPALEDYDTTPASFQPVTLAADITFDTVTYTDATWHDIEIAIDQNKLASEIQGDRGSEYYVSTFEGFVPSSARLAHWMFDKIKRAQVIYALQERNEQWRIFGSKANPAYLYAGYDSGAAPGDKAGFNVTGGWSIHGTPAAFYDGVFS